MASTGSRRIGGLVLAFVLVSACTTEAPSSAPSGSAPPTVTAAPSGSPAPTTGAVASLVVTAPPTSAPSAVPSFEPSPVPSGEPPPTEVPCPTARLLSVREFVEADFDCFAGRDVRIKGWLDTASPFGFEGPSIRPLWLAYPETRECADDPGCTVALALWQDVPLAEDRICSDAEAYCSSFFPHTPPGADLHLGPLGRWLILTGHTDDPAAERCHFEEPPGEEPEELYDEIAVALCKIQFVVTEVDQVDSP